MSQEQVELEPGTSSRRRVLAGAGLAGAAAVLGACGTDPTNTYEVPSPPPPPPSPTADPSADPEAGDDSDQEQDDSPPEDGLAATGDVAVGGGLILAAEGLVVTQPAAGEWRGFSSICTHQGCTVSEVVDGTINCACHGSKFSIEDGSVVAAAFDGDPSQQNPLPEVAIAVEGDQIIRA